MGEELPAVNVRAVSCRCRRHIHLILFFKATRGGPLTAGELAPRQARPACTFDAGQCCAVALPSAPVVWLSPRACPWGYPQDLAGAARQECCPQPIRVQTPGPAPAHLLRSAWVPGRSIPGAAGVTG